MGIFDRVLRTGEGRKLKALKDLVPDINALEDEYKALSDDALRAKTGEFRTRLDNGETLDEMLVEAFAVVREGSSRAIGQRHYDVQLMGGAALHLGWVAEMRTGEGKTLTSLLPAYLNGLEGKGVHIVTVNDYLASRDAEWMGEIHRWLGLSVGLVIPGQRDSAYKREQYNADITYGTNNELGFDYLRDNMSMSREAQVQRGHNFCIVDEIDSILIDEARTPLIISGRAADAAKLYYQFASIVRGLQRDVHYDVDEEKRIVSPLEEGIHAVERALGIENLYDAVQANLVHQLGAALKAKELYQRDKDYIIQDGNVNIVDEFTGRVLEGRRWSDGLHQAVEAKEGVKIKEENRTLATITLQNYFRMYDKLAGMTGTAETEAAELAGTYGLQVVPIPTNMPVIRQDNADRRLTPIGYRLGLVPEERMQAVREKYEAVDREIRRLEHTGIPGSEGLNRLLAERGSAPVTDGARLIDLLRRPQMTYRELMTFDPGAPALPVEVAEQVEISVKYEGYIRRQEKQVEELRQLEKHRLPPDMEYSHIQGLRLEAREKLAAVRPLDLGQASRISGVSPADIAALMIWLHTRTERGDAT